ncbi:hypothetical protein CABS01_07550, partial [Colletotrichum abscissum]|uniref:uncharacterized protein n=1 Tax=Colletotrichum abscissum TaxID=1671311 RepID=UPI0027D740FB
NSHRRLWHSASGSLSPLPHQGHTQGGRFVTILLVLLCSPSATEGSLSYRARARARATFSSVRLARTMTPTPYTTQPPINVVRLMDDGSPPPPNTNNPLPTA